MLIVESKNYLFPNSCKKDIVFPTGMNDSNSLVCKVQDKKSGSNPILIKNHSKLDINCNKAITTYLGLVRLTPQSTKWKT